MSYRIIDQCFHETDIDEARSFFSDDGKTLMYHPMLRFIHDKMIPVIMDSVDASTFIYSKLRISDNNNNTDASAFHRDLISYRRQEETSIPVYTCLCYLDDGQMELIDGSDAVDESTQFLRYWQKRISVKVRAGSIIVIPSKILHRGVFSPAHRGHRRLIQLFECFFHQNDFETYFPRILFIPAYKTSNGDFIRKMTLVATSMHVFWIMNYISFQNALSGYSPRRTRQWLDRHGYEEYDYIVSDARQHRLLVIDEKNGNETNLYWYPSLTHAHVNLLHGAPTLYNIRYRNPLIYYSLWKIMMMLIIFAILLRSIR